MTREEIVVGLDIGTTKVCTVIGQGSVGTGAPGEEGGPIEIIGVGVVPSRGIKKGVVVDVEDTIAAIRDSVARAAHMAGVEVEGAVAGVTGDHIHSSNRRGTVTVSSPQGTVSRFDIERVLQAAALEVPRDREIIHSLPRDFIIDGQPGFKRPIGVSGQHLEVETHVVTGKASFLQNAMQCVQRAGINVEALVLEPIATAEAVTTMDERDMGVVLIDIGGGTSDLAVFIDGTILHSSVLPVGGNHVTRDIAIGLRTPFEVAERLKIESGAAMRSLVHHSEIVNVPMTGSGDNSRVYRSLLAEIIEARMSELYELSREAMLQAGVARRLPGGIVISGGGALLPGALDLASEIFQMPVRLGYPLNTRGWSEQVSAPQFATGVGLCRFALQQRYAPSGQGISPTLSEGKRLWGAVAPDRLVPPSGNYPEPQVASSHSAPPSSALPPDVPVPLPRETEQTLFDDMVQSAPASNNGSVPGTPPAPTYAPQSSTPQPYTPPAPIQPRRDDIRSEVFRREELPGGGEEKQLNWWQKLLAQFRKMIGFEDQ